MPKGARGNVAKWFNNKAGGGSGEGYWQQRGGDERPVTRSSRSYNTERYARKSSRGQSGYHVSPEWYSAKQESQSTSSRYGLRSSRQHSPPAPSGGSRSRPRAVHSSTSPVRTRRRVSGRASSPSPHHLPSHHKTDSWEEGEEERPSSQASVESGGSSEQSSSRWSSSRRSGRGSSREGRGTRSRDDERRQTRRQDEPEVEGGSEAIRRSKSSLLVAESASHAQEAVLSPPLLTPPNATPPQYEEGEVLPTTLGAKGGGKGVAFRVKSETAIDMFEDEEASADVGSKVIDVGAKVAEQAKISQEEDMELTNQQSLPRSHDVLRPSSSTRVATDPPWGPDKTVEPHGTYLASRDPHQSTSTRKQDLGTSGSKEAYQRETEAPVPSGCVDMQDTPPPSLSTAAQDIPPALHTQEPPSYSNPVLVDPHTQDTPAYPTPSEYTRALSMLGELQQQQQASPKKDESYPTSPWQSRQPGYSERDVTPPAEILEVTQHLAQGGHTDFYSLFQNNPHLLKQFLDYYNAYTHTLTGGGGGGDSSETRGRGTGDIPEAMGRGGGDIPGPERVVEGAEGGYPRTFSHVSSGSNQSRSDFQKPGTFIPETTPSSSSDLFPHRDTPPRTGGRGTSETLLKSPDISLGELRGIMETIAMQSQPEQSCPAPGDKYRPEDVLEPHPLDDPDDVGGGSRPKASVPRPLPQGEEMMEEGREVEGGVEEMELCSDTSKTEDALLYEDHTPSVPQATASSPAEETAAQTEALVGVVSQTDEDALPNEDRTPACIPDDPQAPNNAPANEMAVQTERVVGPPEGVGFAEVAKRHKDLQLWALAMYNRRSRELIHSVRTLVRYACSCTYCIAGNFQRIYIA